MKINKFLIKFRRKLQDRSGETLTETLVSVLIISIVSVALASMISTAAKINEIAKDYDQSMDGAIKTLSIGTPNEADITVSIKITTGSESDASLSTKANETFSAKARIAENNLCEYSYTAIATANTNQTEQGS